ncbi:MAG: hypothetical protein KGL39_58290, partial [Patescibacteria group bacterium]|nr:hypothetical protein [Patescibacteria group bacterium]
MNTVDRLALADELEALASTATDGPWEVDTEESDGAYGPGPDASHGFKVSLILGGDGLSLFDALNSTAIVVREDYPDEDGFIAAWDETSANNAALIVALV